MRIRRTGTAAAEAECDEAARVDVRDRMSLRIANEEGSWTGSCSLHAVSSEQAGAVGQDLPMWVLVGEGAHEGLTAILRPDLSAEGSFGGVIVEADLPAAPPMPEG